MAERAAVIMMRGDIATQINLGAAKDLQRKGKRFAVAIRCHGGGGQHTGYREQGCGDPCQQEGRKAADHRRI